MRVEPQYCPYCKIDQLTAERDELRAYCVGSDTALVHEKLNNRYLREDRDRYREALEEILVPKRFHATTQQIAREALKGEE